MVRKPEFSAAWFVYSTSWYGKNLSWSPAQTAAEAARYDSSPMKGK